MSKRDSRRVVSLPARLAVCCLLAQAASAPVCAADWPMWGYDAGRTAWSPEPLPPDLGLRWVLELPPQRPAWPASQRKLRFDDAHVPVIAGGRMFLASTVSDSVTAYRAETGERLWRFHTGGPVRLAPVAAEDRVCFVSDDGHLYCVDAATGRLRWKHRGGPSDRRLIGNGRLVSAWPARGAPVVHDGRIYYAAGIWPFMGIFIHALDAASGRVLWTNSGSGSRYFVQPHLSGGFGGVAPQGYLAVAPGDARTLLVSGGRSVPAAYELATGRLRYFRVGDTQAGKGEGGYRVATAGGWFFNGGAAYAVADGVGGHRYEADVIMPGMALGLAGSNVIACALLPPPRGSDANAWTARRVRVPAARVVASDRMFARLFIGAGPRVYLGATNGAVAAVEVGRKRRAGARVWTAPIRGRACAMAAANGCLFVAARPAGSGADNDGLARMYCFGAGAGAAGRDPVVHRYAPEAARDAVTDPLPACLQAAGDAGGYAALAGGGADAARIAALAANSTWRIVVLDEDDGRVRAARRQLDEAGLYGRRAVVVQARLAELPPYLFSRFVWDGVPGSAGERPPVADVFRVLRPYGGQAWFSPACMSRAALAEAVAAAELARARVRTAEDGGVLLVREGALPGAADWTHQYADAANTVVSRDERVKLPLGLLWFGGPSHEGILPRHGHGPTPQVIGGRLFIEGRDLLRAVDVYTGRLLWERELPGLGSYYDSTFHQSGANLIGSNYAGAPDGVYVSYADTCLRLDPATGATLSAFRLSTLEAGRSRLPVWGMVAVDEERLIGTAVPVQIADWSDPRRRPRVALPSVPQQSMVDGADVGEADPFGFLDTDRTTRPDAGSKPVVEVNLETLHGASSRYLVVLDRHSGRMLWKRKAVYSFRHNTVVAGGGKLFAVDGITRKRAQAMRYRGRRQAVKPLLQAFEAQTGKVLWEHGSGVFGTWLGYSQAHDVLLEAGSQGKDRAHDEERSRMTAYRASSGDVLWRGTMNYGGPCLLHGRTIITQGFALDLLSGERKTRLHPLTLQPVPWSFSRNYGCDTAVGSLNMLTFRSAAAGFYDLESDGGTGNFGGFKSGCTSSLIPANGVLNAPDYTRTCTCSYPNQTSLALVHDPEAEIWTFNRLPVATGRLCRVGLNLGAPGDRMDGDGTLWLEYPLTGGASPAVGVAVEPASKLAWFGQHTSMIRGGPLRWVAASGVEGLRSIEVMMDLQAGEPGMDTDGNPGRAVATGGAATGANGAHGDAEESAYRVRLVFAEPRDTAAGERVFDVAVQGRTVLRGVDVVREAGGPMRAMVRVVDGVRARSALRVELRPAPGSLPPVLCGLDIVARSASRPGHFSAGRAGPKGSGLRGAAAWR